MLREGGKTVNSRSAVASEAVVGDPRWKLVLRIAESSRFAKAARLRDFLLYVCREALESHPAEISEHKIGERVFRRPPHYNSNEDNIVRSHARLLRQRLEAYFETEGADEPLILRIPKGGYAPEFVERPPKPQPPVAGAPRPSSAKPDWLVALLIFAVVALGIATAIQSWILSRARTGNVTTTATPAIAALWSQLFSDPLPTTVVLPDDTLSESPFLPPQNFAPRRYTSYDAVILALRVTQFAKTFRGNVNVRYARDVTLRDLSPGNLVLIGWPLSNPLAQPFESRLNFRFDFDAERLVCRNRLPAPGEDPEYVPTAGKSRSETFSAIGFLPNVNGGNVLLIRGPFNSSQEGAADFVTSERLLSRLADQIGQRGARFPYFDVLLRTTVIDGVSQEPAIVAHRVLR